MHMCPCTCAHAYVLHALACTQVPPAHRLSIGCTTKRGGKGIHTHREQCAFKESLKIWSERHLPWALPGPLVVPQITEVPAR